MLCTYCNIFIHTTQFNAAEKIIKIYTDYLPIKIRLGIIKLS